MTENEPQVFEKPKKRRHGPGHPREQYLGFLKKARDSKKGKKRADKLTADDDLFLQAYLTNGNNATQAERSLGGARVEKAAIRGHYRLKRPAVRRRLMELRGMVQKVTLYTAEQAAADLTLNLDLAVQLGQMTAAARFLELKLKLAGLLIDRTQLEVTRVDLKGILQDAQARAARVIDADFVDVSVLG